MAVHPTTRLFASLSKIEEQDDGSLKVFGIASSGARDEAGEIVSPEAMKAALPDYMKWGAIREMHGSSAAGTAIEASVDSDGFTNLVAHVVDPIAVKKVKSGTYKGFSIGGKVLKRDPKDPTIITALKLVETSLVDRPCNPEASINMWKADMADPQEPAMSTTEYTPPAEDVRARAVDMAKAAGEPEKNFSNYLFKARDALRAEHVPTEAETVVSDPAPEVAKVDPAAAVAEALERAAKAGKMSDMDYGDAKNKKYPLDTAVHIRAAWSYINMPKNQKDYSAEEVKAIKNKIIAAWKAKIDPDGPPSAEKMGAMGDLIKAGQAVALIGQAFPQDDAALAKGLYTVARVAHKLEGLGYIAQSVFAEEKMEGDGDSKLPQMAADLVAAMQTFLIEMVNEEVSELLADLKSGAPDLDVNIMPPQEGGGEIIAMAANVLNLMKADTAQLAKAGKRNSAMDQQHIQAAHDSAMKAGAMCSPDNCPDAADKAAKAIALVEADRDRLAKALTDTAPAIDALTKRLDEQAAEIAVLKAQPLPPKTAGSSLAVGVGVSKTVDATGLSEPESAEALAKAYDAMTPEQKVDYDMRKAMANPIRVRF